MRCNHKSLPFPNRKRFLSPPLFLSKIRVTVPTLHLAQSKSSKGPGNPSEEAVAHIIEGICSAQDSSGKWILNMDVVESGDGLALAKHSVQGQCRSECRTIATSCFEVFEKVDMDDLQVTGPLLNHACTQSGHDATGFIATWLPIRSRCGKASQRKP